MDNASRLSDELKARPNTIGAEFFILPDWNVVEDKLTGAHNYDDDRGVTCEMATHKLYAT